MVLWTVVVVIGLTTDTEGIVTYGPNQQYTGYRIKPNVHYNLAESGVPLPKLNRQRIVLKYCQRAFLILSAKYNVTQGSIEVSVSPFLVSIRTCLHPDMYSQCSKKVTVQKNGTFFDRAKMAPFWVTWNNTGHVTFGSGTVFGSNVLLQHHENVDFKVYYIFYGIDGESDGTYCFIVDLPPLLAASLTLKVTEDVEPGTVIHTFTQLRPKKVYGDQYYKQGVDSTVVNITQTQLLLQRRLDYDMGKTSYAFYMFCKNGSAGVNLTVIIDVIDVHDFKPVINIRQGIVLMEELPPGSPVGPWFLAYDQDQGDTPTYSLSGPDADLFSIDETTGQMTTKGRIDREKTSLLTFSLKVKDKVGHETTTEMKVNVLNVNDNQPLFKNHFQRLHLPMNHRDEYLARVDVTDADEGTGTCHCFVNITGGNEDNVFRMEGLRLKTNLEMLMDLDVLKNKDFQHLVTITATDRPQRGQPLSTNAFVFITIQKPRNFKEPAPAIQYHFTSTQHPKGVQSMQISVAEDAKGIVHTVAVPESYDMNLETAHQQFHFRSDTVCPDGKGAKDYFHLNSVTGELAVARRLNADRRGCTVFTLTIYISDYRTLTETTFMNLTITVTNTNDNPPTSKPPWVLTRLPCNVKPGHHIADFKLSDADFGKKTINVKQISKTMFKYTLKSGRNGLGLIIDKRERPWTKPFRHDVVKFRATDSDVNPLSVVFFAAVQRGDCSKVRRRRAAMSAVKTQRTRLSVLLNSGRMVPETHVASGTRPPLEHSERQENPSISALDFGGEITRSSGADYGTSSANVEQDTSSSSANVKQDTSSSLANVELHRTSGSANVEQDSTSRWANVEPHRTSGSANVAQDTNSSLANVEPHRTSGSANVEQDSTSSWANVEPHRTSGSANVEQDTTSSLANVEPHRTSGSANVEQESTSSWANVEPHRTSFSANVEQDSTSSWANVEPHRTSGSANDATLNRTNSTNTQNINTTNASSADSGKTQNSINMTSRDSMASVTDLRQARHNYAWSSTSTLMTAELPSRNSYSRGPTEIGQGQNPHDCFTGYDVIILLLLCVSLMINVVLGVIVFAFHIGQTGIPHDLPV